ncbi:VOC family protein [Methanothrix soehngenii]|uniref:VOC family protein n=1 Tax=Methanothrix soehngenii TaxID=2223 RepID=UPI003AB92FD3
MRKIDDVGATFYRAQDLGVPIALTLGRQPNDGMISFYGVTPSGFLIELGVDGREVDDRNWEVKTYNAVSDWGHRPVTTAWIEQLRPGRKSPAVRRELGCAGDGPLVAGRRPSPSLADGSHRAGQSARRLDNHRASPPARGREPSAPVARINTAQSWRDGVRIRLRCCGKGLCNVSTAAPR